MLHNQVQLFPFFWVDCLFPTYAMQCNIATFATKELEFSHFLCGFPFRLRIIMCALIVIWLHIWALPYKIRLWSHVICLDSFRFVWFSVIVFVHSLFHFFFSNDRTREILKTNSLNVFCPYSERFQKDEYRDWE